MSTAVLNGLRDYLYGTLSPANMLWLGIQLTEYAKKQQEKSSDFFPPSSTCEELIESAEEGRKRIATGNYIEIDDLLRELDEDFKEDMQNESESSTVDKRELAEI